MIKQITNDTYPSIQLGGDHPSKHQDGKLLILDLKVCIETKKEGNQIEKRNEKASVIMYEFYSRSVASKASINARSALN